MEATYKENEIVIIPAEINGYGVDVRAMILKIEVFFGRTMLHVTYIEPAALPDGSQGGVYYPGQVVKE